jgi:hypothetical protein
MIFMFNSDADIARLATALQDEGFDAYVDVDDWNDIQEVRDMLTDIDWYKSFNGGRVYPFKSGKMGIHPISMDDNVWLVWILTDGAKIKIYKEKCTDATQRTTIR